MTDKAHNPAKSAVRRVCHIMLCAVLAWQPLQGREAFPAEKYPETRPSLKTLYPIPESLGRVLESFQGDSDKTVFLIQDAHAVYDAQKSMSGLIAYLCSNFAVPFVAM